MGSPKTPFGSFAFTSLLTSSNIEVIESHFTKLAEILREFYPVVKIPRKEAFQRFNWVLSGDNPEGIKGDYSFQTGTDDILDHWNVICYRTQIPHLETGLSSERQDTRIMNPRLAYRLVEGKLATVVVHKNSVEARQNFFSRLFGFNVPTTIVGEMTGLYVIFKFDSIPFLQKKWKWEVFKEDSFRFSEFFAEISTSLSATPTGPIVTIPFDRISPMRQFVSKCDSDLMAAMTKSQLEQTLALIGVSPAEWFGHSR